MRVAVPDASKRAMECKTCKSRVRKRSSVALNRSLSIINWRTEEPKGFPSLNGQRPELGHQLNSFSNFLLFSTILNVVMNHKHIPALLNERTLKDAK